MSLTPPTRPQVVLKTSDEIIDHCHRLTEKIKERLTLQNLRLSDRFLNNSLRILIHVRAKDSSKEWACCLLPEMAIEPLALKKIIAANADQMAVLVNNVRIVKIPKRTISTLVWFERVNSFYRRFPRSLYFSDLKGLIVLGRVENRECYSLPSALAYTPALSSLNKLEGEMIQGTTQVVQNVSSNGKNVKFGDWEFGKILEGLARLRVSLASDHVQVSIAKGIGLPLEICEMFFGPFDLYPN